MRQFNKYKSNGIIESAKQTIFEIGSIAITVLGIATVLIALATFTSCTKEPLEQTSYCEKFEYVTVEWKVFNMKSTETKTLEGTKEELIAEGWAFHPDFGHSGMWRKDNTVGAGFWYVSQEIKDYRCEILK